MAFYKLSPACGKACVVQKRMDCKCVSLGERGTRARPCIKWPQTSPLEGALLMWNGGASFCQIV